MFQVSVIFLDIQTEGVPVFPYFSHTMPALLLAATVSFQDLDMMLNEICSLNSVLKFFNKYRHRLNRNRKLPANTDVYYYSKWNRL
jgi:hypothetical protein